MPSALYLAVFVPSLTVISPARASTTPFVKASPENSPTPIEAAAVKEPLAVKEPPDIVTLLFPEPKTVFLFTESKVMR